MSTHFIIVKSKWNSFIPDLRNLSADFMIGLVKSMWNSEYSEYLYDMFIFV